MCNSSSIPLAVLSLTLVAPILHAAIFRFDEVFSLLTIVYSLHVGLAVGALLVGCSCYALLAPCCWSWRRSTIVLPLFLAVLFVLKRDLDHNLLLEFSAPVLRETVDASYASYGGAAGFQGKVVLVTGANSGVGLGVARAMASLGATVVMGCRSQARCETAAETIVGAAVPMALDLSSFASVHAFSDAFLQRYDRLDVLFANAGFAAAPSNGATTTKEGFELGFGTMHMGHFLLFERLRDTIAKTVSMSGGGAGNTRVVMTSSAASQFDVMGAHFHDSLFDAEPSDLRGEVTTVSNNQYVRQYCHVRQY